MTTKQRLQKHAAILEAIDLRRKTDGDQNIGAEIEVTLLALELADLERATLTLAEEQKTRR